jgi:hypothetical protein
MQTVKVKRLDLLNKLRENRQEHRGVFERAQVKFREAVIERLDAMLADARAGKKVQQSVGLTAPSDHTSEYDRAIAMLEMSVEEEITLTSHDFECYVMDRWAWAAQFGATSAFYGVANKYVVSDPNDDE